MPDIEFNILLPALLAGLLVTATHVPLGIQVLRRGIVFIDIAIAQIAGVGVIAVDFFGSQTSGVAVQVSALSAALAGALFMTWTERRWSDIQEGIIGTVFILAASLQVLLLAGNPHAGEYLKDLLVGQILWVNYPQLGAVAALTAVVLAAWFGLGHERLGRIGFYLLFGSVGDRIGTGGRHLPRVRDVDHPGPRLTSSGETSHRESLCSGSHRLSGRNHSIDADATCRPAR